ncbi:MAG: TonB family protein, partial [Candidatus Sulfotelmatobacter sp.]
CTYDDLSMGYQALLFCPDEKVARAVTQVLSELDFTVIPCTEPFGAVKKLMGEHFDAVVVDCDNEQNATLLFKSARNTPANQSSLAVAVVEGQAGVAKAFRIGANLVLTKPINVEQAKGTLRVARGLLRKNEAGKPAAPASAAAATTVKPAKPVPAPPKPVSPAPGTSAPNSRVVVARPAAPVQPLVNAATASIPAQKPAQPKVVASIPGEINESDADILEISDEVASPSIAVPEAKIATTHSANLSSASSAGVGSGAASAPAPARETKSSITTDIKSSTPAPESSGGKVADLNVETSSGDGGSAPAPAFTFGGNVSDGAKRASRGNKKTLLIVAAVVLVAAGGYALWMQWVGSSGAATPFTQVAGSVVKTPAVIPPVAPRVAPAVSSAATSSTTTSAPSAVSSSTPGTEVTLQPAGTSKTSSNSDASDEDDAEKAPAHPGKVNPKANSAKVSAPTVDKAPDTIAAAPAIVIKNDLSQKPVAKPAPTPDTPAPSITGIAAGDGGGAIPNLMGGESNAPAPVLGTLNVSQGVSRGLLVKKTAPVYPPSAMQMHIEGAVELVATISKSGDISAVKVASGNPQLARAAVDAVKQWKYKPYLLNGEPVEIQTQVTVNFKLPN